MTEKLTGGFTMPGEAGKEELCLRLAKAWGADVIRDSDGTSLSDKLTESGLGVYSTVCVIRGHNPWIREHMHTLQQTFLCTEPATATSGQAGIRLMEGFFPGQFRVNDTAESQALWQVYDRTANVETTGWAYDAELGTVTFAAVPFHKYTVSFLAWRLWEEISMYNHTTNNWDSEPLMQLDPVYPEAREYLRGWLERWCLDHPKTDVVRFTSLFYNFTWIWGADKRSLFSDWSGYDFAVSPLALAKFKETYGYALTAEDFTRGGRYHAAHRPLTQKRRDWIAFVSDFVRGFGKELVDIVHKHGKKAYVFCDDSWIGLEPYNGRFEDFGFDGFIKCLFSGYEARFCANVQTHVRELRFHPYLFPVGLGGLPTFSEGGDPARDALTYWLNARRALMRQGVERAGLGGYPSLAEGFPAFVSCFESIMAEFRGLNALHAQGKPLTLPVNAAVLHSWGKLRTWTLSGHFHETRDFTLTHILEALSGLPINVDFIDFEEAETADLSRYNVIINAGEEGDAWSGGAAWHSGRLVERLAAFVYGGGVFLGVSEPSAVQGYDSFLRLSNVLGIDVDDGRYACRSKIGFTPSCPKALPQYAPPEKRGVILTDKNVNVLLAKGDSPTATLNRFGQGAGVYLSAFETSPTSNRFLNDLLLYALGVSKAEQAACGYTNDPLAECAVYPEAGKAVIVNNSFEPKRAVFSYKDGKRAVTLAAAGMAIINV